MFNKFLITLLMFLMCMTAQAQQKPIRMVIPFGTGGLVDGLSRRIGEALERELNRRVVIEPRPGAAGYIGLKHIAGIRNDEILLSVIDAMAVSNIILLYDDLDITNFRYVTQLGTTTSIALAVKKDSKFRSVEDIRNHRGAPINIGINGFGSAHHYYNWLMKKNVPNTSIVEVPFKGVNEMLQNLLGGHIDAGWSNLATLEQQAALGNVDIIAIIQANRVQTSPNVPTFQEQGIRMPLNAKWMIISNQTTDLEGLRQIDAAVKKLMLDPALAQLIRQTGLIFEPHLADNAATSMANSLKQQAEFVAYLKAAKLTN